MESFAVLIVVGIIFPHVGTYHPWQSHSAHLYSQQQGGGVLSKPHPTVQQWGYPGIAPSGPGIIPPPHSRTFPIPEAVGAQNSSASTETTSVSSLQPTLQTAAEQGSKVFVLKRAFCEYTQFSLFLTCYFLQLVLYKNLIFELI